MVWNLTAAAHGNISHARPLLGSKLEYMADSGRVWECFPCAVTVRLKSEHMADSGRAWETFPCAVAEHPGLYFNNLEGVSIIQLVST